MVEIITAAHILYGLSRDDDEVPMKNVTDNIKIKMMVGVNKDVIQQ